MDHEPGGLTDDPNEPLGVAVHGTPRPGSPRLVLIHGFTQNRHCWSPVAEQLAGRFEVVTVDAPGHGEAASLAVDLATAGNLYGGAVGPAVWVGYSMGGRLALHAALAQPHAVTALVLVGASPGIADSHERRVRQQQDDALADRIEEQGMDWFIDHWLSLPLFANLDATNDHRQQRLTNTPAGLASSLRLAGTGAQQSLWDQLGAITCPVLMVTGADDTKFTNLANAMAPLFGGRCDVVVVPGAGHSVHLEKPMDFARVVTDWVLAGNIAQTGGTP
jgi:2-succinyl-6-hydroxy-2,4-cyclohexadiene-1-carboxylate synthase